MVCWKIPHLYNYWWFPHYSTYLHRRFWPLISGDVCEDAPWVHREEWKVQGFRPLTARFPGVGFKGTSHIFPLPAWHDAPNWLSDAFIFYHILICLRALRVKLPSSRCRIVTKTKPGPSYLEVTLNGDWAETMFYNLLSGKLPVRTPRIYYADMNRRTTNFIWIMERVPYGLLVSWSCRLKDPQSIHWLVGSTWFNHHSCPFPFLHCEPLLYIIVILRPGAASCPESSHGVEAWSFNMLKHLRRASALRFPKRRALNPKS
jgi:hypothetical protein